MAKRSQNWVVEDRSYAARTGVVIGYQVLGAFPDLERSRSVVRDCFGGRLRLCPIKGRPLKFVALEEAKQTDRTARRANQLAYHGSHKFFLHYELEFEWRWGMDEWPFFAARVRDLCTYAMILKSHLSLYDDAIAYLEVDGMPAPKTQLINLRHKEPQCQHPWSTGKSSRHLDYTQLTAVLRVLFDRLAEPALQSPSARWQKKAIERGNRVELALVLLGDSTCTNRVYDMALRMAIALEALFHGIGCEVPPLVCMQLLKDRIQPATVRTWLKSLVAWRNQFVHGEYPPFRYPSASMRTEKLDAAIRGGLHLLSELLLLILESDELYNIITVENQESFKEALYLYCARQ